jgi:hypothetical protein
MDHFVCSRQADYRDPLVRAYERVEDRSTIDKHTASFDDQHLILYSLPTTLNY